MSFPGEKPRVIVASASGRWLAQSAMVAQHPVSVIDLFADQDTVAICNQSNVFLSRDQLPNTVTRCDSMSAVWGALIHALKSEPVDTRVLFGGGMEHMTPSLLRINKDWGDRFPNLAAFQKAQGVVRLKKFCQHADVLMPEIMVGKDAIKNFLSSASQISMSSWLGKKEASAGGLGVQIADKQMVVTDNMYLQRLVEGRSIGGSFVAVRSSAHGDRADTSLLGVCEAWPRTTVASARTVKFPFRYRGSFGPIIVPTDLSGSVQKEMERIGKAAADHFQLSGVFGIDFILADGQLWILEINPRFPASAEILERSFISNAQNSQTDCSIAKLHLAALGGRAAALPTVGTRVFAKEVLYMDPAWHALLFSAALLEQLQAVISTTAAEGGCSDVACLTDLPPLQSVIHPSSPIMTLHSSADDVEQLQVSMTQYRDRLLDVLATASQTQKAVGR